jgi:HlyD family secretion protein
MSRPMFRQESLDQASSPDELDRLYTLIPFRAWVPLGCLAVVLAVALVWAVFGSIPDTVEGAGVLVNPGRVRGLQSAYGGQVVELRVRAGQVVAAGDVLAVINQSDLRQSLGQAQARLRELRQTDQTHTRLEADRTAFEKRVREAQEGVLNDSIQEFERFGTALTDQNEKATQAQKEKLKTTQAEARALNAAQAEQYEKLVQLGRKQLVPEDTVLAARATLAESNLRLADFDLKVAEIAIREVELKQSQAQLKTRLADLRGQLRQLDVRAIQSELDRSQAAATRSAAVQEQADRVTQLERQLDEQGQVRSPYPGRVLELTVAVGQVVAAGSRVGAIEVDDVSRPTLRNLAYFPVSTGKRLREGMDVRVTPSTVQRERFGSIRGRVVRVSPFPVTEEAAAAVVGNADVVRAIARPGGMIEVEVELEHDPGTESGFRWTSAGPPFKFSAGTTTVARVTVEQRSPISYLIPLLGGP